jgi:hypothetical protein
VKKPLTRDCQETVLARVQRDHKFARAFYAEGMNALLESAIISNGAITDFAGFRPLAGKRLDRTGLHD